MVALVLRMSSHWNSDRQRQKQSDHCYQARSSGFHVQSSILPVVLQELRAIALDDAEAGAVAQNPVTVPL
jgi:hypothetical protein